MIAPDAVRSGTSWINISSNESAFGPSAAVQEAARKAACNMHRYAEGAEVRLSEQIAHHYGLRSNGVVCGHGSDDLLARIARIYLRPGDELICSVNGYQKFPNYAFANDANPIRATDRKFTADADEILACVNERTRMVMLANPDNPTGTWLGKEQIGRLLSGLPSHILLVLDSAYFEYVDMPDFEAPGDVVDEYSNVVMTRTFSKLYGLAGLRLGWLYADKAIAENVRKIGTTFPISNIAFECGAKALIDSEHLNNVRRNNSRIRKRFADSLTQMGVRVYPSQTNFVLAEFANTRCSAAEVYSSLLADGIIARRFPTQNFADCIRFTIALESQMDQVAAALHELLA